MQNELYSNADALGSGLALKISNISNHAPIPLSLRSEYIETKHETKLVLVIPNDVSRVLKKPVPNDCLDLDYLDYPKQLVIVLARDSDIPAGELFNVTVEQVQKIENDYTIEYRAKVSSTDIEAFNDQHGIERPSPNLWSAYSELNILIGSDLVSDPLNPNSTTLAEKLKLIRLFILLSAGAVWFVFGLVGFVMSDHPPIENITYLLAGLVIWFAAITAHWISKTFACAWFSSVVVIITVWGMQS